MITFWVVTFAWSLALAFFVLGRVFRCVHKWEFVDKTEMRRPIDGDGKIDVDSVFTHDIPKLMTRKVVIVVRCPACGACKVIRESNP